MKKFQRILTLTCALALAATPPLATRRAMASAVEGETYAIRGGTVVTVTGETIQNGVVVIRDGLIIAVGANVPVPGDARVIDAQGMTVYPGLIDAYTSYGVRQPQPPSQPAGANPQQAFIAALSAPQSTVGLLPEVTVTDALQVNAETFDQQRAAGITAALTAPRDGIFQGQSAFLNLGSDSPEKLILKAPASLNVAFTSARGGYPNSLMGTFAFLRQSFIDAGHYRDQWAHYNRHKRGVQRPQVSKSLAALQPFVNAELPVIFNAATVREMKRAVALGEEFKFKYIIAGATQSYQVADYLKQKNATVLLSLSYPQKPAVIEDPEAESLRTLRERADAPKAAAELHRAGVRFAFQSGTLTRPADFVANAARAIEAGLPKDAALRAMTISAAEIFGVAEQLGSIEQGKIANLIVTSGDLFAKDTKVKHVFVDGKLYTPKEPPATAAPATVAGGRAGAGGTGAPVISAAGNWTLTVNSPAGTFTPPLNLQQNGDVLTGEIGTPTGLTPITDGKISGSEISFTYRVNFQGQELTITARGRVEGNAVSGTMETMGQSFGFSGTRTPRNL
jgi:imidazolonepropionase-like amidohydrolase